MKAAQDFVRAGILKLYKPNSPIGEGETMGKHAPKNFDLDLILDMSWNDFRVDRLSRNSYEKEERFQTALHETSHVLISGKYSHIDTTCACMGVSIPRHGRSVTGYPGAAGLSMTLSGAFETGEPLMNFAAGVVIEKLIDGSKIAASDDLKQLERLEPDAYKRDQIIRIAGYLIFSQMPIIDLAATAFLYHSKFTGEVAYPAYWDIYKLMKYYPSLLTQRQRNKLLKRPMYARRSSLNELIEGGFCFENYEKVMKRLSIINVDLPEYSRIMEPFQQDAV